jgi:hypothetical protein
MIKEQENEGKDQEEGNVTTVGVDEILRKVKTIKPPKLDISHA